jgi:hypothetical protein
MVWSAPKTWVAGELVTETNLNQEVRDNQLILKTSLDANGKLVALTATYLANLSGASLTGLALIASGNTHTAGVQNFNGGSTVRLVIPVGADKWGT